MTRTPEDLRLTRIRVNSESPAHDGREAGRAGPKISLAQACRAREWRHCNQRAALAHSSLRAASAQLPVPSSFTLRPGPAGLLLLVLACSAEAVLEHPASPGNHDASASAALEPAWVDRRCQQRPLILVVLSNCQGVRLAVIRPEPQLRVAFGLFSIPSTAPGHCD